MFMMRFDMRAPEHGAATTTELYQAAIEMAVWGEENGAIAMAISEHHASSDGYLPAPLVLASAIAARTKRVPIQIAALLVPLHDPISLAEQMSVLDHVSGGRVSYVTAVGYRPEEYAMFGHPMKGRGERMEKCLSAMKQAFQGEPFEYEGRAVHVTPKPATPGGPVLMMGGNSVPVVKRAARLQMGMITQGGNPELEEIYRSECERLGHAPGFFVNPPKGVATSAFVARDPDAAWEKWGPYLLHDAKMYGAWLGTEHDSVSKSVAGSVDALRAEQGSYRIFSPEEARHEIETRGVLQLHPLCGGLPPEMAWESLHTLKDEVLSKL